jgi:hypothetical protein
MSSPIEGADSDLAHLNGNDPCDRTFSRGLSDRDVRMALARIRSPSRQILPLLVVSIMIQIVLCGGLIPVTGRVGLDQLSWLLPTRWGFAATASTVDLRAIAPSAPTTRHCGVTRLAVAPRPVRAGPDRLGPRPIRRLASAVANHMSRRR